MIYFLSDTHFNHDKPFIYGPRGFGSVADADNATINNWNRIVGNSDEIYMLGDFFMGADLEYIEDVLDILHGKIHLILGNHDTPNKVRIYETYPKIVEIVNAKRFDYQKRKLYLSHYPTITTNYNEDPAKAVYNIHGHIHTKNKFYGGSPYMYNVSCDAQNNTPVSIDQVMLDIDNQLEEYSKDFDWYD